MQGYHPKDNRIFTVTNVPCNRSRCILKFMQSKRSRKHSLLIPRLDYNIHEKSETKTHRKKRITRSRRRRRTGIGQEFQPKIAQKKEEEQKTPTSLLTQIISKQVGSYNGEHRTVSMDTSSEENGRVSG